MLLKWSCCWVFPVYSGQYPLKRSKYLYNSSKAIIRTMVVMFNYQVKWQLIYPFQGRKRRNNKYSTINQVKFSAICVHMPLKKISYILLYIFCVNINTYTSYTINVKSWLIIQSVINEAPELSCWLYVWLMNPETLS